MAAGLRSVSLTFNEIKKPAGKRAFSFFYHNRFSGILILDLFIAGMSAVIDFLELFSGQVGINLSGGKRLMAEKLLNAAQICAVI